MFGGKGIVGDFIMWAFLGAFAVLAITKYQGFSSAIGSAAAPVEFETSLIASGGTTSLPSSSATSSKKAA
jgi:hypothetical protein